MKRIKLQMIRHDLNDIPQYELPEGYSFRLFQKGDEAIWANIETRVDEFKTEATAIERFEREFGPYIDEMGHRYLFIENAEGEAIGTATAWYGDLEGDGNIRGRIHWVGIVPEHQGRGLSKPLLSEAMNILAKFHDAVYLTSQTTSWQAVNMYLNFGFKPARLDENYDAAWALLEEKLGREIEY
ncbi:GNAT family N-acetyltransferase [Salinicoccus sp. HZC-1]|uniref:GNAT family N-acetyltransferase n=1 Tax=Salinicoccus sp. HZC-1 TaxID=3385497 RepID=UPI00398BAD00